jgi:hypothetical protein
MAALLYIIGVTYYGCNAEYFTYGIGVHTYWHWLLLALVVPHYFRVRQIQIQMQMRSNFFTFFNWLLALSIIILLGTFGRTKAELLFIAYFSLAGCYILIGNSPPFSEIKRRNNPWLALGSLSSIVMLLFLSFKWFWEDAVRDRILFTNPFGSEFYLSVVLTLAALLLFLFSKRKEVSGEIDFMQYVFLVFIVIFILGNLDARLAMFVVNITVFALGVHYIRKGARVDHLGILNYGLLILAALIVCRYFDSYISFLLRGILFMLIGVGFFVANSMQLKKRKIKNTAEE